MNIHFQGTLTRAEYVDIFTLINSRTKENPYPEPRVNRLPLILLLVMAAFMAVTLFSYGMWRQDLGSFVMIVAPALLVFLIILNLRGAGRLSPAVQAERIWRNEANLTRVLQGDITDEGILMKWPTGETLTRWNSLFGYGEYKDILVLAPYNDDFLVFPQRFFEREADWDEFRNRVVKRMGVMYRVLEPTSNQRSPA